MVIKTAIVCTLVVGCHLLVLGASAKSLVQNKTWSSATAMMLAANKLGAQDTVANNISLHFKPKSAKTLKSPEPQNTKHALDDEKGKKSTLKAKVDQSEPLGIEMYRSGNKILARHKTVASNHDAKTIKNNGIGKKSRQNNIKVSSPNNLPGMIKVDVPNKVKKLKVVKVKKPKGRNRFISFYNGDQSYPDYISEDYSSDYPAEAFVPTQSTREEATTRTEATTTEA